MNSQRSVSIRLKAEVADFTRQIGSAAKSLDELTAKGDKTGQTAQTTLGRMAQSMQLQREAWTTAGTAMLGVGTAITGVGAAALATGVSYNTLQQSSRAALTTLTGDAEAANAQMDRLDEFASTSPFAKDVFIRAQQQMLGFGIEAQKVIPYLDAIQNAVAATGGSNQDIAELSLIMSQISAAGKITGQDLMQFAQRGVDAATLIGSQMGMTGAQIREEITAGSLDAGTALDALAAGMQETYGGAADNVKNTFVGAWDRVKAAWRDLSSELAAPLVGPEGGGLLTGLLNQTADVMRAFQDLPAPIKIATTALGGVVGAGALAGGAFLTLAPRVMDAYNAFQSLREISPRLTGVIDKVAGPAGKAAAALGKMALAAGTIVAVETGLQAVEDAIYGIDRHVKSLDELEMAFRGMGDGATYYGSILGNLADEGAIATDRFGSLAEAVQQVADPSIGMRLDRAFGLNTDGIEQVEEALRNTGELLASMPAEEAGERFRAMWQEAGGTNEVGQQLLETMPAYRDSLLEAANAAGLAEDDFNLLRLAAGDLPPEMQAAAEAAAELSAEEERLAGLTATTTDEIREQIEGITTLYDLMRQAGDGFMSLQDAQAAWGEEIAGLGDTMEEFAETSGNALNETGDNWDFLTERGRFANEAINDLAESGLALLDTMQENGASAGELEGQMATVREEVIGLAEAFGMSREDAEALADSMGLIPQDVSPRVNLRSEDALDRLADLQDAILRLDGGEITINGNTQPAEDAVTGLAEMLESTDSYYVEINGEIYGVEEALDVVQGLVEEGVDDIQIDADPELALGSMHGLRDEALGMDPLLMHLDATPEKAATRLLEFEADVEASAPQAAIDATNDMALLSLYTWQDEADGTTGVSGLDAEDRGAADHLARTLSTMDSAVGTTGISSENRGATGPGSALAGVLDTINSSRGSVGIGGRVLVGPLSAAIGAAVAQVNSASGSVRIGGFLTRASGGPVYGPGTATSDSIPALLSNGEHVLSAREVIGLGGHGAVAAMRAAARDGMARIQAPRFATGGQVGRVEHVRSAAGTSTVVQQVPVPTRLTVVDTDGVLQGTMRVAAHAEDRAYERVGGIW